MKTIFSVLLLASLGCHTANSQSKNNKIANKPATAVAASYTPQDNNSLEGKWQLIPALPSDTATGKIPEINFAMDSKRIAGNNGCNNFSGTFNIDKNSLTFNNDFISTKMSCAGYDEEAFDKNLMRTNNYEINGDTLSLKVNQTPLSYWIRVK